MILAASRVAKGSENPVTIEESAPQNGGSALTGPTPS